MEENILKVSRLTVKLRIDGHICSVIEDLCFEIKKGETLALVGESGCGKSITAHAILRILPEPPMLPPTGEILYHGIDLLKLKEPEMRRIRGKRIAIIFQDPISALNPVYTIGEQLREVVKTHLKLEGEAANHVVIKSLEEVQLPDAKSVIKLYPHQLSGGMLQRAMIAMALLCSPDLLIADEPTTALDVTIQAQILKLLRELQEKKGMATLLITHDMGVVAQNADRVIVMYAGDHVEKGTVHSLFENPAHPYTQALFSSRPDPFIKKKKLAVIPGLVPRLNELPLGCRFHPRCRYAMEMCRQGRVPTFSLKEKEHSTKCWLYDKELDLKMASYEETACSE